MHSIKQADRTMKTLTPHEKINLRAWMSRCTTGTTPMPFRIALPLSEVLRMAYAMTGRSANFLAGEQPSLIRAIKQRPSDCTRFERRRRFSGLQA